MNRRKLPPHVYVVDDETGGCKIGVSAAPYRRLADLQRERDAKLRLIAVCQCPTGRAWTVERQAHRLLADRRLSGEWFDVSAGQAIEAVSRALAMVEAGPLPAPGWTVASVSTKARRTAARLARRESLTVGRWLEQRVAKWEAEGSPMTVSSPAPGGPAPNLGDLAQAWQAARALADAAGIPVPPHIARNALAAVQQATRQVRGLSPPTPRQKPPGRPLAAIEGEGA